MQLVTPIMTRRKTRPKKTSPETMYTIADVIEMETEASISSHLFRGRQSEETSGFYVVTISEGEAESKM